MRCARRCYLKPVIVGRKTNRTTTHRIVAMAEGIRKRLPNRKRRIERLVDSLDATGLEPAGNRHGLAPPFRSEVQHR